MPLEPTERRDREQQTSRMASRRALLGGGVTLLAATLTACSGSSMREAGRGREKDASRESVVKGLQATETWNLVNPESTPGASTPEE